MFSFFDVVLCRTRKFSNPKIRACGNVNVLHFGTKRAGKLSIMVLVALQQLSVRHWFFRKDKGILTFSSSWPLCLDSSQSGNACNLKIRVRKCPIIISSYQSFDVIIRPRFSKDHTRALFHLHMSQWNALNPDAKDACPPCPNCNLVYWGLIRKLFPNLCTLENFWDAFMSYATRRTNWPHRYAGVQGFALSGRQILAGWDRDWTVRVYVGACFMGVILWIDLTSVV